MNAIAVHVEAEERLEVEEAFKVQVGPFAGQFHVEKERPVGHRFPGVAEHLEIVLHTFDRQVQICLLGWAEHPVFSSGSR